MASYAKLALTGLLFSSLQAEEPQEKWQITYLARTGKLGKAIDLYGEETKSQDHDFELLEQLGLLILEEGARSQDPQKQIASIYGAHLAAVTTPIDILEEGVRSKSPETQLACIQTLATFQDDRCDDLLLKAMSSPFLPIRLEAGYYLALRKHPAATGQLEALLTRIPPFLHFMFPQFFALIGTKESISILRELMDDPDMNCKVEAILSAAMHNRDDLLSAIRKKATHHHPALQESTAAALGLLQDTSSIPKLKKLIQGASNHVKVAAAKSLLQFGAEEAKNTIEALVKEKDLFAIQAAAEQQLCLNQLALLTKDEDMQVRLNAAIGLLMAKDARCWPALSEFLLRDMKDLGIVSTPSPGHSMAAWKAIPSLMQRQEVEFTDLFAITLAVREHLLRGCLDLGAPAFLQVVSAIFERRQTELVPMACHLLENLGSKEAKDFLEKMTQTAGAPLIRAYAALSLYRMSASGPYEEMLKKWLAENRQEEILKFRPLLPFHKRPLSTSFELSPEETSRLLIEIYQAIADRHTKEGIDLLLSALRKDASTNRYALAGLLLHALQ